MKKVGLMRFRLNQVWNKEGGFALSTLFEYKDENAYVKGQKVIEKHYIPMVKTFITKVVGSRGIVVHEFNSEELTKS